MNKQRAWWLVLSLAACDPAESTMPAAQGAPPPVITASALLPGQPLTVQVTGVPDGTDVGFRVSPVTGPGACPTQLFGVCLRVGRPGASATAVAAGGSATPSLDIPPILPAGTLLYLQAAGRLPSGASGASGPIVRRAGCGDGVVGVDETCDDGDVLSGDGCDDLCACEPGGCLPPLDDPNLDGPFAVAVLAGTYTMPGTGVNVPMRAVYPTAGQPGAPYPVVLVAHGFQLPPSQYHGYVERLATHGFVALTVDFQAGFFGSNHVANSAEVLAGLDWVDSQPALAALADTTNAGVTGHSLGGKLAILAASRDARIQASVNLDPVDGTPPGCSAANCPDASALLPLPIPTAFLGETLDATGVLQACAPAAQNFQTFFANADSPSLSVDVLGAGHMSFLDDLGSCGLTCLLCRTPTLSNATVNGLARAYVTAFYGRYLKGDVRYEAYLTGLEAQMRYVDTGLVSLQVR